MDNDQKDNSVDQQGSQDSQDIQTNPPTDATHRPKLPARDPQILEEGKKIGDLQKRDE